MSSKQYEEFGKGLINLGNGIGILSFINQMFSNEINVVYIFLTFYIVVGGYVAGLNLIGKAENA